MNDLQHYLAFSETIPGWTRGEEARALADAAYNLDEGAVLVEIGSFFGSSTVILAGARKLKGSGKVHSVDPFDASGDSFSISHYAAIVSAFAGRSQREHFDLNVRAAGLSRFIEVHCGKAEEVAANWATSIDMLFLDGDQSDAGASAAYEAWSPWLNPGGIIALHNSNPREYALDHGGHHLVATTKVIPPNYTNRRIVGSITFAHKAAGKS